MVAEVGKSPPQDHVEYELIYNKYPILKLKRLLKYSESKPQESCNQSFNLENESHNIMLLSSTTFQAQINQ
jgi:hypothetical protein